MSENVPIMTILDSVCLHAEDADDSKDVSRKLGYLRKRKQNISGAKRSDGKGAKNSRKYARTSYIMNEKFLWD